MQKGANPLFSFLDWYYRITAGLAAIVLIIITGIITAEILFRLILNESIQFVMQFSGYSLYIVTFLSAAWVLREGSHIVIDFVTAKFSERTRPIVSIAIHVLAVLLCAFLFWQAADYIRGLAQGHGHALPDRVSLVYLYFLMPLIFFPDRRIFGSNLGESFE